jgi:protein-S-isoprenylcysteine O-methyltransferase Ste14
VPERRRAWIALGAVAFFLLAPGTVAGLIPRALTGWRVGRPLVDGEGSRVVGLLLVLAGVASLIESFVRFALKGWGTPAPVAAPTRLVVSGQYRHVRNPMYVAVISIVLGQALIFGSTDLLTYAAVLWIVFTAFVMVYEEPKLTEQFGASYREYRHNVRRWWPRARPWQP